MRGVGNRRTSVRLAVLASSAVVATMVAAAIAFNVFVWWKVEADAVADIEYGLDLDEDGWDSGRSPKYLSLDASYGISLTERGWSTEDEKRLAAWFSSHPAQYVVNRITFGTWTCYAAIAPADDFFSYYDYFGDDELSQQVCYYVAYIDTTSEQSLIASVNTAFVLIGVAGALAAAVAGFVAGQRIDEAQEAQKRFYENMSHDLKTPLAAIRGYAEGARDGVVDVAEAADAITRATGRMSEAIDEILNLSRLEAGAVQPHKEPLEVEDFVQDCLMPLEGAVRAKGIEVGLDLVPGEVQADPRLFDHALSNVLANAVRHAATRMEVRYDGARLCVWNDGDVPESGELRHLFDRFHVGEGGSTGVGLAITKEVATLHGWQVDARLVSDGLEVAFTF